MTTTAPHPSPLAWLLLLPVHFYRKLISPLIPPSCRFYPSCSEYAVDALTLHGGLRGLYLAVRRVLRCHPWHEGGFDPVPERFTWRAPAAPEWPEQPELDRWPESERK